MSLTIQPQSIPPYDRVSESTDSAGNKTITYWDKRYTAPVHIEWVPAPPMIVDSKYYDDTEYGAPGYGGGCS
jgi:hypothetical protein